MDSLSLSAHAMQRALQRAVRKDDLELITWLGTEVEGGYLVTARDVRAAEQQLKRLTLWVRKLAGKRVVVADGNVVTVYHARPAKERRLLRHAEQRSMGQ